MSAAPPPPPAPLVRLDDYAAALDAEAAFGVVVRAAIAQDARLAWMTMLPRWDSGTFSWLLPAGDGQLRRGADADALEYAKTAAPKIVGVLREQERQVAAACRGVAYNVDALAALGATLGQIATMIESAGTAIELRRAGQNAAMLYDDAVAGTAHLRDDLFGRRADPAYLRAVAAALRARA